MASNTVFVRSPYNYDGDIVSFKTGLDCSSDPSRAQQHMRDETDINVMVAKFSRGMPIPTPPNVPASVDFDEVYDFQSAMNVIVRAEQSFASLPSSIRTRFQNDPAKFLAFVYDDRNRDEAVRLGLVPKPVDPEPPVPKDVPPVEGN